MDGRTRRIAQIAFVALALLLGTATATALAQRGGDDGTTTGTTGTTGTTQTGTTTTPAPAPPAGRRVVLLGTVTARDEAAGTFALEVRGRKHHHHGRSHHRAKTRGVKARAAHSRGSRTKTWTVRAATLPAVGAVAKVKGRTLADGTVEATRVKVLASCDDDTVATTAHDRGDDRCGRDRGRGRGDDDRGDDNRGRGRGDDDRGGDDRGRGRDHAEDD